MEWLLGVAKSLGAVLSPLTSSKRKRGEPGTAEEKEVEQSPPCKRRAEPELPPSRAQFDLAAGVSSAARAKSGARDRVTRGAGQGPIRSGTGRAKAPAQRGRETLGPTPQSPGFEWSEFPLPKRPSPAVQRQSAAEDKQPPTVHPSVPLLHPPGSRLVQAAHPWKFGKMGLGGSKPSSRATQQREKEMLQLAVQINAKLEGQPGLRQAAHKDNLEVDLTGPSAQPEAAPPEPAPPLHPWADWLVGAAARRPDERSVSLFTDSFVRRTQGILRDVLEPTDNELDFQRKKQASTLAIKRVEQLEVSFGALLRKVDAAIEHGAEEAAERLQRELLEIERSLRLERERQAQQAVYAEDEVVVESEQSPVEELPPLPAKWYDRYEDLTSNPSSFAVIASHQRSKIDIRWYDMAKLAPLEWLNDEVINVYMSMLLERDARRRDEGVSSPTCHFFSSFFANKLYKDNKDGYVYEGVRRWTLPKRLKGNGQGFSCVLDCDRIIMPVHQGVHWVCAVIDLKQRKFVYYDSLQGQDQRCLESLAKWLRDEYKDKRKDERDDVLEWPREYPKNIPEQKNGCDCGVFTLLFADYAGRDAPMRFTQEDIQYFRVRIVSDIMALRVE